MAQVRANEPNEAAEWETGSLVLLCAGAWAVPGAAHVWLGQRTKGALLFGALALMFTIGLVLQGRLFPFDFTEPLVGLAACAHTGIGALYILAGLLGLGRGEVRAVTYEYGNAFLIVAGLLNVLVIIDAYDIALHRK